MLCYDILLHNVTYYNMIIMMPDLQDGMDQD